MLLTIRLCREPADDLGYLLHKHPDRVHTVEVGQGKATVFFPERTSNSCTAVLMVELDAVGLVRGSSTLEQYVTDRPYTASSFLSVALNKAFRSAANGTCREKPELPLEKLPFEVRIPVLPATPTLVERLFAPLGYTIQATPIPGSSSQTSGYLDVTLTATTRLCDLLNHLYVLIPVSDDQKHYYVDESEIDKLLTAGEGWLKAHPDQELIASRYLKHRNKLTRLAIEQLQSDPLPVEDPKEAVLEEEIHKRSRKDTETPTLNRQRYQAVLAELEGCDRVADLGCGEGQFLQELLKKRSFRHILGMDVSLSSLQHAERKIQPSRLPEPERLTLIHGSLLYHDDRLKGFAGITLIEVIEHLPPSRLPALADAVFGHAHPPRVVVTTPNSEYNILFPHLQGFRHLDHRFEWTRTEFQDWCSQIASKYSYTVSYKAIGSEHPEYGPPTQLALFTRQDAHAHLAS